MRNRMSIQRTLRRWTWPPRPSSVLFAAGELEAQIDLHGRGKVEARGEPLDSFFLFPAQPVIEDERVVEIVRCPHAVIAHPQSGETRVDLVADDPARRMVVGQRRDDR